FPLSAQLDRHRREVRLVARSVSAPRVDRRRRSSPAALGRRRQERARGACGARGHHEEQVIEQVRRRLRGEAGYSMVEMLTVMVIMSIVFAGITDIFISGSKAQAEQDRRFQAQLATRLALDKIRKDIHCASD